MNTKIKSHFDMVIFERIELWTEDKKVLVNVQVPFENLLDFVERFSLFYRNFLQDMFYLFMGKKFIYSFVVNNNKFLFENCKRCIFISDFLYLNSMLFFSRNIFQKFELLLQILLKQTAFSISEHSGDTLRIQTNCPLRNHQILPIVLTGCISKKI